MVAVRKTRGGVLLVEEREWFARLVAQGVSNAEACRIVGINRKTGIRWRYGRTIRNTAGEAVHYRPVRVTAPTAPHPRYLSLAERTVIADLHRAGVGVRGIAEELGRAPSTVSRELRRNIDGPGRYLPATAQRLSVERRSRAVPLRRVVRDNELHGVVTALLDRRWSPEQVSHELRSHFPDQPERHLCTESIYQAIYDPRTDVTRPAKRRRRRRRRHVQGLERRGRITNMTMIADRPVEVDDRVQVGHWEGDCIMGSGNRSAIGTLVERTTRFLILVHLPTGRPAAENIRDGIVDALGGLPPHLRRTLTWDQGKEMALHQQITTNTGTRVYFCDAHSPWQRGSNENTNGLLRDYFPKGTDLSTISPAEMQQVADELNDRPRKTLGWARPAALIAGVSIRTA
ncbi:IS30 family transposase [[Mycobacterium] vasticus]|uniref:IS30 family transposase n=1 Tax=[Mycobacterium] vasticus TaxID=2875777 RepID=A0ABU5Z5C2_9MYCO|nr:IS30 family transposase [Mycolicibacter sp. MYC017]MEB3072075.1 IS30 family transposase [Mycolicibacter sp. MYC017]